MFSIQDIHQSLLVHLLSISMSFQNNCFIWYISEPLTSMDVSFQLNESTSTFVIVQMLTTNFLLICNLCITKKKNEKRHQYYNLRNDIKPSICLIFSLFFYKCLLQMSNAKSASFFNQTKKLICLCFYYAQKIMHQ